MVAEANSAGRTRRMDIVAASGIVVSISVMLVMVAHHPVAAETDAAAIMGSIARQAAADRLVHGTLAAAMTVTTATRRPSFARVYDLTERVIPRVDLKSDRQASRLVVGQVTLEDHAPAEAREMLDQELARMAGSLGLDSIAARNGAPGPLVHA